MEGFLEGVGVGLRVKKEWTFPGGSEAEGLRQPVRRRLCHRGRIQRHTAGVGSPVLKGCLTARVTTGLVCPIVIKIGQD